jgi:hypothetical protein
VAAGPPSVSCILVGVIAGTGGGCAAYVVGLRAEVTPVPLAVTCGAAIVGVRLLSTHREWRMNPAESLDLSHRVARIRRRTPD